MNEASTLTLHTGAEMPVMGLGTWQLTNDTAETIAHALEQGYRMIDTSGDYGTQPGIGEGIRQSGVSRDALYLVTKVEETDDAYEVAKRNLEELQLETVDLLLIHRPPADGVGEELWRGLQRAKADGMTYDIGVSNYSIRQLQTLIEATGEVPVVNQIEWSPFGYDAHMFQFCQENGIIIQAYSPLTRTRRLEDPVLKEIAEPYNVSPAQLLIRWNLQHGTVPIPKANQWSHLEEDIRVFEFEISDEDMARLDALNEGYSSLGSSLQYVP